MLRLHREGKTATSKVQQFGGSEKDEAKKEQMRSNNL